MADAHAVERETRRLFGKQWGLGPNQSIEYLPVYPSIANSLGYRAGTVSAVPPGMTGVQVRMAFDAEIRRRIAWEAANGGQLRSWWDPNSQQWAVPPAPPAPPPLPVGFIPSDQYRVMHVPGRADAPHVNITPTKPARVPRTTYGSTRATAFVRDGVEGGGVANTVRVAGA